MHTHVDIARHLWFTILCGAIACLSLSRWSPLSAHLKFVAGWTYILLIFASISFGDPVTGSDDFTPIELDKLRFAIALAFGVGIALSIVRRSTTWEGRWYGTLVTALLLYLLCYIQL